MHDNTLHLFCNAGSAASNKDVVGQLITAFYASVAQQPSSSSLPIDAAYPSSYAFAPSPSQCTNPRTSDGRG